MKQETFKTVMGVPLILRFAAERSMSIDEKGSLTLIQTHARNSNIEPLVGSGLIGTKIPM